MNKQDLLKNTNDSNWIFNIFIFPLLELFLFYAVTTYLLLLKIPVTALNFVVCYLIGQCFLFFSNRKYYFKSFLISTLMLIIPMFLCSLLWDYSWDGNAYHKLCAGLIKEGWNPVYETISTAIKRLGYFSEGTATSPFYDGYPKASYIIAAVIYAITNNVETGKAYTLLSVISSVGIVYYVCRNSLFLNKKNSVLISLALCCNTVTMAQSITYYNDGLLHSLVFIVCAELFFLYKNQDNLKLSMHHLLIAMSIIIGVNLKYSAMILFFLPCLVYFSFIIFRKKQSFAFVCVYYVVIVFCAIGLFGLTSYIHNIVFHHNPLYTLIGEGKTDVLSPSIPFAYRKIPNVLRLVCSIFSPSADLYETEKILFKIPFTFSIKELYTLAGGYGSRMAGWGIFYSGLFCISIVVFIVRMVKYKFDALNLAYIIIFFVSFIPAFFINCLNNARYWPFLFLFPCWLLYVVVKRNGRLAFLFLCALIFSSPLLPCMATVKIFIETNKSKNQLLNIKENNLYDGELQFNFPGLMYNLHDNGIYCKQNIISKNNEPKNKFSYFSLYIYY